MTRTPRVPMGSMLKGDPLGKKSAGGKSGAKAKPAPVKKGGRK